MGNMITDRWRQRTYVTLRQPSLQPSSKITSAPFGRIFSAEQHKTKYMLSNDGNQRQPSEAASRPLRLTPGHRLVSQASSFRHSLSGRGRLSRAHARAEVTIRADTQQQQSLGAAEEGPRHLQTCLVPSLSPARLCDLPSVLGAATIADTSNKSLFRF